ncbi:acyl carrier protein [Fibrobacter succinogenes]|uniref:Uncharacterized protein n=1 Tax=Fibrobacter succinogenes TaxID=833 RepID=A0A380S653_FIBSU|nr:acyl carrier protein [Fibrobacter succinogenes]PWJ35390.1 phosphopantetheine binding protein [Fibrobacter succinogenes subsp. elongatus]SUQ24046.1 hypothetical protein SAMN05661053_1437 [Fibrobacter succinogenes]
MNLNEFIAHVAEQFEETDASQIVASTKFQELEEYSSLIALCLIAMVDEEYGVTIKGNDLRSAITVEDLYNIVKGKKG